MINVEY